MPYVRQVSAPTTAPRFGSIDLLRGLVMVLMALDHVRDYFHGAAFLFNPEDLEATTVPIFLTRWITHYCAPVFVFLAGTSAWIIHQRKSTRELTAFLVKRGIWLILVEITLVKLAWQFNPGSPRFGLLVIWALGVGMLALAALIHLPFRAILLTGLVIVGADQRVGVDDRRALFALSDMSVQRQRLAEGHPGGGLEASGCGLAPQQDDVDAAVRRAVVPKRSADAFGGGPGLGPGPDPGFELGDDLVGDAGVEVGT